MENERIFLLHILLELPNRRCLTSILHIISGRHWACTVRMLADTTLHPRGALDHIPNHAELPPGLS